MIDTQHNNNESECDEFFIIKHTEHDNDNHGSFCLFFFNIIIIEK
jgi:hypothetical protein